MARVENPTLSFSTSVPDNQTTITVKFDAVFTPFDRQLSGLGCTWHQHILIHPIDQGVIGSPLQLPNPFKQENFNDDLKVGTGTQRIPRTAVTTVPRSSLDEDSAANDSDELICTIRLHSDVPPPFTEDVFTPSRVLTS